MFVIARDEARADMLFAAVHWSGGPEVGVRQTDTWSTVDDDAIKFSSREHAEQFFSDYRIANNWPGAFVRELKPHTDGISTGSRVKCHAFFVPSSTTHENMIQTLRAMAEAKRRVQASA